ncbi:MAG: orotate phosphoribosyltransferase [Gammaproteobacteria bacterium RIFCSPHIGHO2_12_FULL_38_14]|nr:MAG: orotate phosphoribosyltransferase [Gammaproteobacteria bacterium RIFCSPHIGHO2_12_FULL_38_14]
MTPQKKLIHSLYQIGVVQFGTFTLKSGQTSSIYINLRKIISYPSILKSIAMLMWEKAKSCPFDLICGVPYTAMPIATCISLDHDIPMIMRRKEKKEYGTKQLIEGVFEINQSCLIIEDVITTGSSILETITDVEYAGLHVKDVIALLDREQGGKEIIQKRYQLHTILTLTEVLNELLNGAVLNSTEKNIIKQFLSERSTS